VAKIPRRDFLRQLAFAPRKTSDKATALVCVFLRGGADTLNMLIPTGDELYYSSRPTLAIAAPGKGKKADESALKLDQFYALHPRMAPLLDLYHGGKLAFIQGVGSDNPSGSHFEAQDQMEHGLAYGQKIGGGWLGRFLQQANVQHSPLCAVCIGPSVPESLRGAPSASAMRTVDDIQLHTTLQEQSVITNALAKLYGADASLLNRSGLDTLDLLNKLRDLKLVKYQPAAGADYPKGDFGSGLREIARLIKANVGLRVACLDVGGWDTHFFQGSAQGVQAENIDVLAKGLAAFQKDLGTAPGQVCTLVMTEFGRRTYENSSLGTDHGKAFAMMAMGSHIRGGTVYGAFPGLKQQESDVLGPSGLGIQFDYRSVFSEVLETMDSGHHDRVFPQFQSTRVGFINSTRTS
jgi:uncharacterized protein (DUF1501 family)